MPESELKLIKRCTEFVPQEDYRKIPRNTRGIYTLLWQDPNDRKKFDVVYVGMTSGKGSGAWSRLYSHARKKKGLWTHFSLYEVWDNITKEEIAELEGLFRAIYRRDLRANRIAVQRGFRKLKRVQMKLDKWEGAQHVNKKNVK